VGDIDWVYAPGISNSGAFTLSWAQAGNASDYEVEEDTVQNFTNPTVVYQGSNTSCFLTGRSDGTYYYRVRGKNTFYGTFGNYTVASNPHVVDSSVPSVPQAPSPPSTFHTLNWYNYLSISVSWAAVPLANGYDLDGQSTFLYGGALPGAWTRVATGISQPPYVYSATDLTTHHLRVRAHKTVGSYKLYSTWTGTSFSVDTSMLPGPPQWVNYPASSSTGTYYIMWNHTVLAVGYELQEDNSPAFPAPTLVYSSYGTGWQALGKPNGVYYYRIRTIYHNGTYSAWNTASTGVQVQLPVPPTPPSAPAWIHVPSFSRTGQYTVQWASSTGASTYVLEEDSSADFPHPSCVYAGSAIEYTVPQRADGSYYYRVYAYNNVGQSPRTEGPDPCVVQLQGELTVSEGAWNLPTIEVPGLQGVTVLRFRVAADGVEDVVLNTVRITDQGSADLAQAVSAAWIYEDVDDDGLIGVLDRKLSLAGPPFGRVLTFSNLSLGINRGAARSLIVQYDISQAAPIGTTLHAVLQYNADVGAQGQYSSTPLVTGAPVDGKVKSIEDRATLCVVPLGGMAQPSVRTVTPGEEGVEVLALRLIAGPKEPVQVNYVAFSAQGSGDEPASVSGVSLYLDADGSGEFEPDKDYLLAGPATFATDDGVAILPAAKIIGAGMAETWFVVYDFSGDAQPGTTFTASFNAETGVYAWGLDSVEDAVVSGYAADSDEYMVVAAPECCSGGCMASAGPASGAMASWLFLAAAMLFSMFWARRKSRA
jgi:hypothetical protein